jgi:hypothetical protein
MMDYEFEEIAERFRLKGTEIIIYMDDILIATTAKLRDHREAVHTILDRLEELDLYLKPEKCVWESPRVDYLGLILEKGVTRMDPAKVAGVRSWPIPTTVKQVRSFLGFCNFYRPFIRQFSHTAKPLNELTRKDIPWDWTPRCQDAFETLRQRITSEPVLIQPNLTKPFELEVDASGFALGAVLTQRGDNGKKHPISYYSTTLTEAERNYDIWDLELLAVVKGLRHWRAYLAGSPHKVTVYTDHANLLYWRQPQKISRRIAREVLELSEYNIKLRHIPGNTNSRADMLSRRPDYDQGERDNENITVLPDHLFARALTTLTTPLTYDQDLNTLRPWVNPHKLKRINGCWWKGTGQVITLGKDTRRQIIHDHHDLPAYGHPGISRTTQLVTRYYWWPQIARDVHNYVKGCAECQRHKVNTQARKAPLNPITPELDALPFQTIAMDFIVNLPKSEGYDSILTIMDHDCSKAAIFIPCNETIDADGVADLYLKNIFVRYGLPSKVICDRDPHFISRFMQTLCKRMGIKVNASTAYHPRTDGQSERSNQWLEQWLRPWTNFAQDNWHKYLPFAEFAHNSWHNETTKQSPFQVLMGYHPRANITPFPNSLPRVETRIEEWIRARQQVREAILIAQQRWAHSKYLGRTFKIGDKVWLEGRNLRTEQPTAKLAPKRHGPFPIKKVLSPITYQLTLPPTWKIHDVFHVDLLTPYVETEFHGPNYTRPPPDLINEEEEYEVERVLSSRRHGRGRKVQYLVKWKGYPDSDNEWVNWDDMNTDEALEDFRKQNPRAITHIRRAQSAAIEPTPTLHSWIYSTKSMSQDALCAALPYAQCESPVPEAGVPSPLPQTTISYVGSQYSPPNNHPGRGWYKAWHAINCFEPSSWRTPTDSPHRSATSTPELVDPTAPRYTEFSIPQTLIGRAGSTPHVRLLEDLVSEPSSPTDTITINPDPISSPMCSNSPLPIPPQLDYLGAILDQTRRLREGSQVTGSNLQGQEATPVQDHAGAEIRGGHQLTNTDTNGRTEVDEEDVPPVREAWTPPPEGYQYNLGDQYVPMHIKGPDGRLWPAKFTKVEYTDNPRVCGYHAGSPTPYSDYLYAEPYFDLHHRPRYSKADLWFLSHRYPYRDEVDLGFLALKDQTIKAEVRRYRGLDVRISNLLYDLQQLEERLGLTQLEKDQCVRRLEQANTLERMAEANGRNIAEARGRVAELLQDMEHGCST